MCKVLLAASGAVVAVLLVVGTAYAWSWTIPGSSRVLWGGTDATIVDGDNDLDIVDEAFVYVCQTYVAIGSDYPTHPRALLMLERVGPGDTSRIFMKSSADSQIEAEANGDAFISSDGGSRVEVEHDGDVSIFIGIGN